MAQHGVVGEGLDHGEHLLVVDGVNFLLRAAALELPVPVLEVAHLVDGADHKVEPVTEPLHERAVLPERRALNAELESRAECDAIAQLLAQGVHLREVGIVRAVGDRVPVLEAGPAGLVPLGLHAVVHVLGEANLVQVETDGVERHLAQGVGRVVGVPGVNVVVSQHVISLAVGVPHRAYLRSFPHPAQTTQSERDFSAVPPPEPQT